MENFIENLFHKKIFIMTTGKMQLDFEYIFDNINICGYVDEKIKELAYNKKPIKTFDEVLHIEDAFIIVCEEKTEERKRHLEKRNCNYLMKFCFAEDTFSMLDYDLQETAAGREIVVCGEREYFLRRKPDLLLDAHKYGERLYGIRIENPLEFKEWEKYFIVVTVDSPAEIFSVLETKGLNINENYIWYQDAKDFRLPREKKIAYYGCGRVASRIINKLKWKISRCITLDELSECNKKDQYVIITESIIDQYPILARRGFNEIEDYVHWNYIEKSENLKPSELLKQTIMAPVLEQPDCNYPYEMAYITMEGELYGCISPAWNEWSFGNILYENCYNAWNSIYAKIFRLSIINRTFCFCKEKYCLYCNPVRENAEDNEARYEHVVGVYPKVVKASMDTTCNLHCESCRDVLIVEGESELKKDDFIINRMLEQKWPEHIEAYNIAGNGEVFFSKTYRKLLYDVIPRPNAVQILSNGILFTKEEFEKIQERYSHIEVEISMDAASKKTYEKLRRGGNWDRLMRNLKYLGEERKQGHIKFFTINMTVQRDNYQEIPEFINLGKEVHADTIAIRPLLNWGTYTSEQYCQISMISYEDNWVSNELQEVLQNPILKEKEVDYMWFAKRFSL